MNVCVYGGVCVKFCKLAKKSTFVITSPFTLLNECKRSHLEYLCDAAFEMHDAWNETDQNIFCGNTQDEFEIINISDKYFYYQEHKQ